MKIKKFAAVLFAGLFLLSCSNNSVDPEEPADTTSSSSTYYLRGQQSHIGMSCFYCDTEETPYVNYTEFSVNIYPVKEKVDTVLVYGLEGANAGVAQKKVFPDCAHPDECRVYARLTPAGEIEIDIKQSGRSYRATGFVYPATFTLSARYIHNDISITYDLFGERVPLGPIQSKWGQK